MRLYAARDEYRWINPSTIRQTLVECVKATESGAGKPIDYLRKHGISTVMFESSIGWPLWVEAQSDSTAEVVTAGNNGEGNE